MALDSPTKGSRRSRGNDVKTLPVHVAWVWGARGLTASACVIYLCWEFIFRGTYQYATAIYDISDADEWRYTACSRLVAHGYSLFDQVFSAQPPLLFLSLAAGMRTVSDSIVGARAVEVAAGLISLLCTVWIARLLGGRAAGVGAALILSVSPAFLVYSHAVEAEGPMMALATLSLALNLTGKVRGRRSLVVLAALALSGAILIKLFAVAIMLPSLWIIWSTVDTTRRRILYSATFLSAVVVPIALAFLLFAPRAQWQQVVAMHTNAAALHLSNLTSPGIVLLHFFILDAGLTSLALSGLLALAVRRRSFEAGFLALWLPGQVVMLLLFRPLFPHHPAILLTSLAVSGGMGCASIVEWMRRRESWLGLLPAVAALVWLVFAVRIVHDDRHVLVVASQPVLVQQAAFVAAHSGPTDFVAVDDLALADAAHRLVVPPLCDPSNVRLASGYLTRSQAIRSLVVYRPKVVFATFGIYRQVPGLFPWLAAHLRLVSAPDGGQAYLSR